MAQQVKNLLAMQETQVTQVQSPHWEDLLEKEMTTHSSVLAWKIPWTEEFGGLQYQFSSVAQSRPTLWPHESQQARPPCPSPTPRVYWNSCPLSRWCHPAISSSAVPFSSCPQTLPASGSFPMTVYGDAKNQIQLNMMHKDTKVTILLQKESLWNHTECMISQCIDIDKSTFLAVRSRARRVTGLCKFMKKHVILFLGLFPG